MNVAKNRVITIDYTLTDDNNNIIDTTAGSESFDYLHGFGNIIPGLEKALEGKGQGDRFSVTIPAVQAYGERDERMVVEVPLDRFQGAGPVKKGMRFHAETSSGFQLVTVTQVRDQTVTIDGNHPLAGLDLIFDVTINAIREAKAEELAHGHVHSPGQGHSHEGCGGCVAGGSDAEGCGGCRGNC
jgi:FKBP-type peptidyl-prolyl cis-trans isomerase SlyD